MPKNYKKDQKGSYLECWWVQRNSLYIGACFTYTQDIIKWILQTILLQDDTINSKRDFVTKPVMAKSKRDDTFGLCLVVAHKKPMF